MSLLFGRSYFFAQGLDRDLLQASLGLHSSQHYVDPRANTTQEYLVTQKDDGLQLRLNAKLNHDEFHFEEKHCQRHNGPRVMSL